VRAERLRELFDRGLGHRVGHSLRVRGLRHAGGDGDYPATARHALQRELGELERIARVDREDVLQLLAGDDVDRSLEDDAGVY
jgi:hypothetical protein